MIETELDSLETQIDDLIKSLQQTRLENNTLRKKIVALNNENISLLNKNKKTIGSIKNLMMQLQDKLLCQSQK